MNVVADIHAADRITRFGIVGAGLIGGSIAKAIAAADGASTIAVYDLDERNRGDVASSVAAARPVDELTGLADCQCVFVCTPVSTIASIVRAVADLVDSDATIIDCGSVKGAVIEELEAGGKPVRNYVPGHPMSGGSSSGPGLSTATIISGSPFILCPAAATSPAAAERAEAIVRWLGARPLRIEAAAHDRAVAATSHLPHLLAFALAAFVGEGEAANADLVPGSFRSISRYAAGDARIWSDIFRANRSEILCALTRFEREVADLRELIGEAEAGPLEARLAELARRRRLLGD